jgi:hypothetical protein
MSLDRGIVGSHAALIPAEIGFLKESTQPSYQPDRQPAP